MATYRCRLMSELPSDMERKQNLDFSLRTVNADTVLVMDDVFVLALNYHWTQCVNF